MYWVDSREQHGTGRRSIQPADNMTGVLGGSFMGKNAPAHDGRPQKHHVANAPQEAPIIAYEHEGPPSYEMLGGGGEVDAHQVPESISSERPADLFGREAAEPSEVEEPVEGMELGFSETNHVVRSAGLQYYDYGTHMQDAGTSAPIPAQHGRGRRFIAEPDHQVVSGQPEEDWWLSQNTGRKAFIPTDNLKSQVLKPFEEIETMKHVTNADMKDALREWLTDVHSMDVVDKQKWDDVRVVQHGSHWVVEALTKQRKSISREGPTAKGLADKFSMMAPGDLLFFGIRHVGNESAGRALHREKKLSQEHNPTLVSPGVHYAVGNQCSKQGPEEMSCGRKETEDKMRRYIASGRSHFVGTEIGDAKAPGQTGHTMGNSKRDAFEEVIGHGRRHITAQDNLFGATCIEGNMKRMY